MAKGRVRTGIETIQMKNVPSAGFLEQERVTCSQQKFQSTRHDVKGREEGRCLVAVVQFDDIGPLASNHGLAVLSSRRLGHTGVGKNLLLIEGNDTVQTKELVDILDWNFGNIFDCEQRRRGGEKLRGRMAWLVWNE
jgi:hypothetical protein